MGSSMFIVVCYAWRSAQASSWTAWSPSTMAQPATLTSTSLLRTRACIWPASANHSSPNIWYRFRLPHPRVPTTFVPSSRAIFGPQAPITQAQTFDIDFNFRIREHQQHSCLHQEQQRRRHQARSHARHMISRQEQQRRRHQARSHVRRMTSRQSQGATIICHRCRPEWSHPGGVVPEAGVIRSNDAWQDQSHAHLHVLHVHRVCQRAYRQGAHNVHAGRLQQACWRVRQFQLSLAHGLPWWLRLHHQAVIWRYGVLDWPAVMDPVQTSVRPSHAKRAQCPCMQRCGHGYREMLWHSPQRHHPLDQQHN